MATDFKARLRGQYDNQSKPFVLITPSRLRSQCKNQSNSCDDFGIFYAMEEKKKRITQRR